MKTTPALSADTLREQLTAYEQQIAETEERLGAAALDGSDVDGHHDSLQAARDGAERVRNAMRELDKREAEQARRDAEAAASAERKVNYEWIFEYLVRVEAVMVAQSELRAAEQHLLAIRQVPGGTKALNAKKRLRGDPTSIDLDTDLVASLPDLPRKPKPGEVMRFPERFRIERGRELRQLAEQRAAEEAAGDGVDRSGVPSAQVQARASTS